MARYGDDRKDLANSIQRIEDNQASFQLLEVFKDSDGHFRKFEANCLNVESLHEHICQEVSFFTLK